MSTFEDVPLNVISTHITPHLDNKSYFNFIKVCPPLIQNDDISMKQHKDRIDERMVINQRLVEERRELMKDLNVVFFFCLLGVISFLFYAVLVYAIMLALYNYDYV